MLSTYQHTAKVLQETKNVDQQNRSPVKNSFCFSVQLTESRKQSDNSGQLAAELKGKILFQPCRIKSHLQVGQAISVLCQSKSITISTFHCGAFVQQTPAAVEKPLQRCP